jgi:hypothetical protein
MVLITIVFNGANPNIQHVIRIILDEAHLRCLGAKGLAHWEVAPDRWFDSVQVWLCVFYVYVPKL